MANVTIPGLTTTLTSVDRAADLFEVSDTSDSGNSKKTTINNMLNIASQPLGLTDTQSPTNKTLDNTNTITVKDTLFTLQDDGDTTKQAKFQLSGITTATTRTYTLPNASSTLVDLSTSQTLTNKTLTSPTISAPTITNPTITVDTISEFTSANGVTIDGLNIKDGKLNTANSVVATNITAGILTNAMLSTTTGELGGPWTTWSPTWTNLTVGNGTTLYKYIQIGKTVHFRILVTFGSTSSIAGTVSFTPPVTIRTDYNLRQAIGITSFEDAGTASFTGVTRISDAGTTLLQAGIATAGGTYTGYSNLSSTIPMTWTTGDQLMITGTYEAA